MLCYIWGAHIRAALVPQAPVPLCSITKMLARWVACCLWVSRPFDAVQVFPLPLPLDLNIRAAMTENIEKQEKTSIFCNMPSIRKAAGILCNRTCSHDCHGFILMWDITLRCWDVAPAPCPHTDVDWSCGVQIMTWHSDGMWHDLLDSTAMACLYILLSLRMRHCLYSMANAHGRYCIMHIM